MIGGIYMVNENLSTGKLLKHSEEYVWPINYDSYYLHNVIQPSTEIEYLTDEQEIDLIKLEFL